MADDTRLVFLLVMRSSARSGVVRDAVTDAASRFGALVVVRDVDRPEGSGPSDTPGAMTNADLVIIDVNDGDANAMFEVGSAQGSGRPLIVLFDESQPTPQIPITPLTTSLPYRRTTRGIHDLQRRLKELFVFFVSSPTRARNFDWRATGRTLQRGVADLAGAHFENLCFELLTQMGYQNVRWLEGRLPLDLAAELERKDPDGADYRERWLVALGRRLSLRRVLDAVAEDPELLERTSPAAHDPKEVVLLLVAQNLPRPDLVRLRQAVDRTSTKAQVRVRLWDTEYLENLVSQFPQLAFKYFGRAEPAAQSRQDIEALYRENVTLFERLEHVNNELRQERSRRAAAEREAAWKDVAFTAAHKLGNPLFAAETQLQLLRKSNGDSNRRLEELGSALERAKLILEQFKSLTRAERLTLAPLRVSQIVRDACRVAELRGLRVAIEVDDDEPFVAADRERLREVFDELVANALKWCGDQGKLTVTISREEAEEGEEDDYPFGGAEFLRVTFADTGPGVAPDDIPGIFQPFVTNDPHGTGLGLALVERIVEAHKGQIYETGTPGDGAVFEIELPIADTDG